jgi:hypothetical protein
MFNLNNINLSNLVSNIQNIMRIQLSKWGSILECVSVIESYNIFLVFPFVKP